MCELLNYRVILVATLWTSVSLASDYDILKFEVQLLSDVPIVATWKMFRGEKRISKFNVTAKLTDDPHSYDAEAQLFRSAIGNNNFVLTPFVVKASICDFLNIDSERWYEDINDIANHSNLPRKKDATVDYCDLLTKDKQYYLANYYYNSSKVPEYAMVGTYKFIGTLIDRNTKTEVIKVLVITRVY